MKKSEIIKTCFAKLIDYEFAFSFSQNRPGYECVFEKENNIKIIIDESEDYRDENRIHLEVKRGTKILFSFWDTPMINADLINVDVMVSSVNLIR